MPSSRRPGTTLTAGRPSVSRGSATTWAQGIFRSVGKAFAADFVPSELRASGVGWYTATIGLSGLVASIVGGELWTSIGPPATFLFGAASALLGSLALVLFVPRQAGE